MGTIVKGKFGNIELSKCMVDKLRLQARELEEFLRKRKYEGISGWLSDNSYAGCGDSIFQQDLMNWSFCYIATDEGFAWLKQNYSEC